jgi:5'-nucleotidase
MSTSPNAAEWPSWPNDIPLILVTNDDGIDSPGLRAAVESVRGLGTLVVVAPTSQQTSRGRGMSGNWDDHLHPTPFPRTGEPLDDVEAYHVDASPALAVQHAMNTIFHRHWPDLIVSGVNYGENLGIDITISGTVGAVLQGAAYGIPGIAASQQSEIVHHYEYGELDWDGATRVVRKYASQMVGILRANRPAHAAGHPRLHLPRPFPFDILKIDVPIACPPGTPERFCRLARRHYFRHTIDEPRAGSLLRDGRTWVDEDPGLIDPDTDIHAVLFESAIAVTPLTTDCTADVGAAKGFFGGNGH